MNHCSQSRERKNKLDISCILRRTNFDVSKNLDVSKCDMDSLLGFLRMMRSVFWFFNVPALSIRRKILSMAERHTLHANARL